ncbi:MAG: extracellular solute-binding protein [Bacteroidota bacterium]
MRILSAFLCTITLLLSTACGDGSSSNDRSQPTVSQLSTEAPKLSILTYQYNTFEQQIVEEFEAETNIDVTVYLQPMKSIISAAQNGTIGGDLVFFPTLEDAVRLRNFEVLQPFFVESFSDGTVDDRYVDNEGYYAGLRRWSMVAVYNFRQVAEDEVNSYLSLVKAPERGLKIGVAHPDSSGLAGIVSGLYRVVNPQAAALWTKTLNDRIFGPMSGNDYDQLERLKNGEIDIALVSVGALLRWTWGGNPENQAAADNWQARYPKTQTGDFNFVNISGVSLLAGAPNRSAASRFIDFLYQQDNQEKLGNYYKEFPTQVFAIPSEFILGLKGAPGREVTVDQLEENIPQAWAIINNLNQ